MPHSKWEWETELPCLKVDIAANNKESNNPHVV